jgi:hypothetical protein
MGYKIKLPQEDEQSAIKKPFEFLEAIRFFSKIKTRL